MNYRTRESYEDQRPRYFTQKVAKVLNSARKKKASGLDIFNKAKKRLAPPMCITLKCTLIKGCKSLLTKRLGNLLHGFCKERQL